MAKDRYRIVEPHKPHFMTCTVVQWLPLFSSRATAQFLLDSFRFLQENEGIIIYAYVILENHLHLIAQGDQLAHKIGRFKSYTARCIIDHLKAKNAENTLKMLNFYKLRYKADRDHQLWQEGSHPIAILNVEMMRQKVGYIHKNPVKRGYVDDPLHWRYSSARNYAGQEGLIPVTTKW